MSTEKKSEEAVLFPEAKIEGANITIRPWTFGDLLDVNPYVEAIFARLEEKNIALDFAMIGIKEIKELYFAAAPQLLEIIKISAKKTEEEVRALDLTTAVKILYVIWEQNKSSIKNAASLLGLTMSEEGKDESSSDSKTPDESA